MSYEAVTWVKALSIPKAGEKLIMMLLADRINNDTGECYPGQLRLAEEGSMSERSVRKHLTALEAARFITRRQRRGEGGYRTSDCYSFPGFMEWRVNAAISAREHHKKAKAELGKRTQPEDSEGGHRNVQVNLTGHHVPGNLKENLKKEKHIALNALDASPQDVTPPLEPSPTRSCVTSMHVEEEFILLHGAMPPEPSLDAPGATEPVALVLTPPEPEALPTKKRRANNEGDHNTNEKFQAFWEKYPHRLGVKTGKQQCYKHWKAVAKVHGAEAIDYALNSYIGYLNKAHKTRADREQYAKAAPNWFGHGTYEAFIPKETAVDKKAQEEFGEYREEFVHAASMFFAAPDSRMGKAVGWWKEFVMKFPKAVQERFTDVTKLPRAWFDEAAELSRVLMSSPSRANLFA